MSITAFLAIFDGSSQGINVTRRLGPSNAKIARKEEIMLPFRFHKLPIPLVLHAKKPLPYPYPRELKTLGNKIRKRRLDLELRQDEAAPVFGVQRTTISNWERGASQVQRRLLPAVYEFLGYCPLKRASSPDSGAPLQDAASQYARTRPSPRWSSRPSKCGRCPGRISGRVRRPFPGV